MKTESSCLNMKRVYLLVISIHSFNCCLLFKLERKAGTGFEDIQNQFYQGKHKVNYASS